ncbi:hypothetical protein CPC08DRAFT_593041, partial [Agrocybe pediades]
MEFLSQFDVKFVYVKGEDNSVADALSRMPSDSNVSSAYHVYAHDDDDLDTIASVHCLNTPWAGVATALAELTSEYDDNLAPVAATLTVESDPTFVKMITEAYKDDKWVCDLRSLTKSMPDIKQTDGLWYIGNRLVIPRQGHV